jgi:hypothetical protein
MKGNRPGGIGASVLLAPLAIGPIPDANTGHAPINDRVSLKPVTAIRDVPSPGPEWRGCVDRRSR